MTTRRGVQIRHLYRSDILEIGNYVHCTMGGETVLLETWTMTYSASPSQPFSFFQVPRE